MRGIGDATRIFDRMVEAVAVYRTDGTSVYLNPATVELFGARADQLVLGRSLWDVFPDAVGNPFHQAFLRVAETGADERFEHFYQPFNRSYENHIFKLDQFVVVIARDVTERRRTARRLTVLAEAMRAFAQTGGSVQSLFDSVAQKLVEALGDSCAIRMLTSDGKLMLAAIYDRDPERVAFARDLPLQSAQDGGSGEVLRSARGLRVERLDWQTIAASAPVVIAEVMRRLQPHSAIIAPILDGTQPIGVINMFRVAGGTPDPYSEEDLTLLTELADRASLAIATAHAFDRAEHARDELAAITDSLPALVASVDGGEHYRFVNLQFENWFGPPRDRFIGRTMREMIGEIAYAEVADRVRAALAGELQTFDSTVVCAAGIKRDVRVTYVPRDEGGFVAVVFDQSERVELERRKDEFLAMLGHELRNPLAPIETALHLMRLRGDARTERERAVIERQVGHMVRLVDDLLDVARITRGKITLDLERIEASEVVAKAIEMASPLLEQRNHRLVVDVKRAGLAVLGDPERLAQIMANLLTNAAKYTDAGGTITVAAQADGEQVVMRVRDTGRGIAPELLPRLFEPFTQATQAIDRSQGGLGLGLAIVRSLTQMHGGTVDARSPGPGKGSEFIVRVPAAAAIAVEIAEKPAPRAVTNGGGRRVLIVDDNSDAADMLAEALRDLGFEVRTAYDGPTALELAPSFAPEVGLLDIGLPVMDGYELAQRMRELNPKIHLVAVSGYAQRRDRELSRKAGFDAHLAKPIRMDALRELLGKA